MPNTFEATLDDFKLDCETIEDGFEKEIAVHEFPYRDGALLEDMGQKARSVRLRCFFLNERYDEHIDFLNHLEKQDLFELFHPAYGLMQGSIRTVSVRHDEREQCAEIAISFLEAGRGYVGADSGVRAGEAPVGADVGAAAEGAFADGLAEQEDSFLADVSEDSGALMGFDSRDLPGVMEMELDPDQGLLEQVPAVPPKVREYMKELDRIERVVNQRLAEVTNPTTSLLARISLENRIPSRMINMIARAAEREARAIDSLRASPCRYLRSLKASLRKRDDSAEHLSSSLASSSRRPAAAAANATCRKQIRRANALRLGLEAAYLYAEDQERRRAMIGAEGNPSFDVGGRFVAARKFEAVMNVRDLEESLAEVRGSLQETVDEGREADAPKTLAEDLLRHVNEIKIDREKIVSIDLDNAIPLHLVCFSRGLPYNAAERVLAINNIRNPNYAGGTVSIYLE